MGEMFLFYGNGKMENAYKGKTKMNALTTDAVNRLQELVEEKLKTSKRGSNEWKELVKLDDVLASILPELQDEEQSETEIILGKQSIDSKKFMKTIKRELRGLAGLGFEDNTENNGAFTLHSKKKTTLQKAAKILSSKGLAKNPSIEEVLEDGDFYLWFNPSAPDISENERLLIIFDSLAEREIEFLEENLNQCDEEGDWAERMKDIKALKKFRKMKKLPE
jgi:hypothetical protein